MSLDLEPATLTPTTLPLPEAEAPLKSPAIVFTSANLRVWGKKSALSLVDQGLTSAAGFGVNIVLARLVAPEIYGAFAVAFAGFLFISGFHNVLLLEPLSVFGPSRYAGRFPQYFRSQLVIHSILVGGLSLTAILTGLVWWRLAPASPMAGAILGGGAALPSLLLLWLVRRMCYVVQRPAIAALGSGFYFGFIAAGLFVLEYFKRLGSFSAFLLMACGSLLAAGILARRLELWPSGDSSVAKISWRNTVRENWKYGRWLVGSVLLFSVSSQTQTFLVAATLGLGEAGILRAMQIPSLVMTQVVAATGLLVLPTLSYDFGRGLTRRMRHKAFLVSIGLFGVALCFAAFLLLEAGRVEHILYGGKYAASAWLMPLLALIPVANGISMGYSMALRASQKPRFDLVSNLFAAPVAILSAIIFMRVWGLAGAAASMLLSFVILSVVTIIFFAKSDQRAALTPDSPGVLP